MPFRVVGRYEGGVLKVGCNSQGPASLWDHPEHPDRWAELRDSDARWLDPRAAGREEALFAQHHHPGRTADRTLRGLFGDGGGPKRADSLDWVPTVRG